MGNMGYCRFQNTLGDLRECYEHWDEFDPTDTDNEESKARGKLLKLCQKIVADYGEEA